MRYWGWCQPSPRPFQSLWFMVVGTLRVVALMVVMIALMMVAVALMMMLVLAVLVMLVVALMM